MSQTTDNRLRIVFMGTPDFAVPALEALYDSEHEIIAVYTQPPRPKGRGGHIQRSPVHLFADERGIPVYTPEKFHNENDIAQFKALKPDVAVVAGYGMLLPQTILDAPRYGCINIHPSILPRWRGASPVQFAIWKGDERTGVSIMKLVKKMDAGPVIAMQEVNIDLQETYESLNQKVWTLGSLMIVESIKGLAENGAYETRPQLEEDATYTKMFTKEDGRIDWNQSAQDIDRQIRALNPWPGVWTTYNNKRLKILEVVPAEAQTTEQPGTIINREGHVACGNGTSLKLIKLQPDNAKAMDFVSALNGGYIQIGSRLS